MPTTHEPNKSWTHVCGATGRYLPMVTLADIARDPEVAAFLNRGTGDSSSFAVPARPQPTLIGGEAVPA